MSEQTVEYQRRYDKFLKDIANNIEDLLKKYPTEVPRYDLISARAKTPESFAEKATREDHEGSLKYNKPLTEIQDQIGARVIVLYKDDIEPVVNIIQKYLRAIEVEDIVPESHWEFGYFGRHLILDLPTEVIPQGIEQSEVPKLFELQIKTLFQHAWSETNHDLGYKPVNKLDLNQKRRLAFTSAQAWGADQIFQELWRELQEVES